MNFLKNRIRLLYTKKEDIRMKTIKQISIVSLFKKCTMYLHLILTLLALLIISAADSSVYSSNNSPDILLDSINTAQTIYFEYGKSALMPEVFPILERIALEMEKDEQLILNIRGYTDDKGSDNFNFDLSLRRAEAVKSYLVSIGIKGNRITTTALGEKEPVNENNTEEERLLNRRVVFSYSGSSKNTGRSAIDKFPHRRLYAEGTLANDKVNSMFTVISRNEIRADISIRDSAGNPVDSVRTENISAVLKWDSEGKFDSTEGSPRLIPINNRKKIAFSLTMDYSGSMYGVDDYNMNTPKSDKIIAMEKGIELFIDQMGSNMFCKLIKFGDKVLPPLRFTKSKDVLYSSLENNSYPMGGTALYSSIYTALSDTTFQSNPTVMKAVIAFTDGMENSSVRVTLDSIYRKSNLTGTKIFTIGLFSKVGEYTPNEDELMRRKSDMVNIAQKTGGFFYLADNPGKLKNIYASILDQVLKSYSISIIWNQEKLPPKGTQVKAELKINVNGAIRVVYKNYIME